MRYAQGVTSRFQTWLYLLGLTTALFTGCTNKAAQQGFERPPAPVSVSEAVMQDVPNYIDAIGKTVAREVVSRSEEHTSELQSLAYLVCRLLLEKKKPTAEKPTIST